MNDWRALPCASTTSTLRVGERCWLHVARAGRTHHVVEAIYRGDGVFDSWVSDGMIWSADRIERFRPVAWQRYANSRAKPAPPPVAA